MALTHDEAFLEDICDRPEDDDTRLIYADWLDDRDEPARAEFIRVQVEQRRLPADDVRQGALRILEQALLQEHEEGWRGELPVLDGVNWEDFAGGFVEAVFVNSVEVFFRHARAIFDAAPIRRLQVGRIDSAGALRLSESSDLARLTELNLGHNPTLGRVGVRALGLSPHLANLRALLLHHNDLGHQAVECLAGSKHLGRLEELYLAGNDFDDEDVSLLVAGENWRFLTELDLRDNRIGDGGVEAIGASTRLPLLSTLYLVNNRIGPAGTAALAWAENLPGLARLYLNYNRVGDEGANSFCNAARRASLRDLDLRQANIGDAGGRALAECDSFDGLDLLWLAGNSFSRRTLTMLRERFGNRLRI